MSNKEESRLVNKPDTKINWGVFQNSADEYKFLKGILKIVKKYTGLGIAEMVSKYKRDEISRDHIQLAALNVFLAVHAGKAAGDFLKVEGDRKAIRSRYFVEIKRDANNEGDKITDTLASSKADAKVRKERHLESAAMERKEIYINVMHRVNKLLDALESASKTLSAEWGHTNG